MEQKQNSFATGAATDEPASSLHPERAAPPAADAPAGDILDFEPVPLRYRADGLTPQKQREFVEALADTGVAREAAARIGVSEQAIARVRRRSDARAFDLSCEAAQRIGARRLRSVAYERAVEGRVKRRLYRGEVVDEEVVYDNRLLVYLLGKVEKWLEPPAETDAVIADWDRWMDAVERGTPAPEPEPEPDPEAEHDRGLAPVERAAAEFTGNELWEEKDGRWWTYFPPPRDFDGEEHGRYGDNEYRRSLSDDEEAALKSYEAAQLFDEVIDEAGRRDRFFGFVGGIEPNLLTALSDEAETYKTSAAAEAGRPPGEAA